MTEDTRTCPECGTPLADGVAEGLCARCLLRRGMEATPSPPFAAPEVERLQPLFPDLDVIELVGQGGMGAVYKARQRSLDRLVALKVLPPQLGEDPQFAERFAREARTMARLHHPGIVAVHDSGEVQGLYYLVMEYAEGKSLRQLLERGKISPERALHLVPQICDALEYAHAQGVVHRDIKPENILVDPAGRVHVADFGLAKLGREPGGTLTGARDVVGTPHYMAPEQLRAPATVDRRADLYALGVMFYEMLTGELPIGRFPPPSERSTVDARVDQVVFKALEPEPAKRYDSAAQMKRALEGDAPVPRAAAPARTAPAPAVPSRGPLLCILLAGIVGFVAMFLSWSSMKEADFDRHVWGEESPFDTPFFERHRRRPPGRVYFSAWNTNVFGIPNGLLGILGAVLAVLAAGTWAALWRTPWSAFAIPAGCAALQSLVFAIGFAAVNGAPAAGCVLTFLAMDATVVAALQLRPRRARSSAARTRLGQRRGRRR